MSQLFGGIRFTRQAGLLLVATLVVVAAPSNKLNGMMSDRAGYANARAAYIVAASLHRIIKERIVPEGTKQTRKLTDININAIIEAVESLIITNPPYTLSWPANSFPLIELSAHNRTEWLRENPRTMEESRFVVVKPSRTQPLDLQIRSGDLLIANVETELGGARARKYDHNKLISHSEVPMFSVFYILEKSFKNIERSLHNLQIDSSNRQEPFIYVVQYWPDTKDLCDTFTYVIATRSNKLLYKSNQ